ncbi:sestrin-3-like isoform X2 [Tigriopus californicus]|uniref:sestrin-3-like isoform X2 n=1 Tax=Tigriopus californicus TaxID=6832 RepID=UPI0027DA96E3|nr:sestrin-3-like isoform X2 [Tigriopus californicus]
MVMGQATNFLPTLVALPIWTLHVARSSRASSRQFCSELVTFHQDEFHTLCIRDSSEECLPWLKGLRFASQRMKNLNTLNILLAHRPWMINQDTIKSLTNAPLGRDKWSVPELVHAIILLSHYHAFACFAKGCGFLQPIAEITPKNHSNLKGRESSPDITTNDELSGTGTPLEGHAPSHHNNASHDTGLQVQSILQKMETLSANRAELEIDELKRRFEDIKSQATNEDFESPSTDDDSNKMKMIHTLIYSDQDTLEYVDFISRENPGQYSTHRMNDFSWKIHGFPTAESLYNEDICRSLDDKFDIISNLTYMTIGKYTSVDTTMFRRSVQNYIQCLYGIRQDDYDYGEVNELLPRPLKKYIKTLCCYPDRCQLSDYQSIMTDFLDSEKVHVCLLACEAKFEASLIYALRGISQYFSGSR